MTIAAPLAIAESVALVAVVLAVVGTVVLLGVASGIAPVRRVGHGRGGHGGRGRRVRRGGAPDGDAVVSPSTVAPDDASGGVALATVPIVIPDAPPAVGPGGRRPRVRRWATAIGARRLRRWRARRRAAAASAGTVWDPHERPPWHVMLGLVDDGSRDIAVRRFRLLRDRHPAVEWLHGRRTPGRRGVVVDHLLVGPAGVVVASSRRWDGFVEARDHRLLVAGRDRTRDVSGVVHRVRAVREVLAAAGFEGVPVRGVLHCIETKDVLLDGTLEVREVPLLDAAGTLGRADDGDDVLTYEGVRRLRVALERGLPPAG